MKVRINLDTKTSAAKLVEIASTLGEKEQAFLTDGNNMRVSAKSLLGAVCAQFDFNEIWLETENDHFFLFKDFIVEE